MNANTTITYAELAVELGFGEDYHGFLAWADLGSMLPTSPVSEETANTLREALAQQVGIEASHGYPEAY